MAKTKTTFTELAKAKIRDRRNLVISEKSSGEFVLAQQIIFKEDEIEMPVFLKGAISFEDVEGLYNLRDALNEAIAKAENN